MRNQSYYWIAFLSFTVLLVVVVAAMAPDFRPAPLYQRLTSESEPPPPPGFHEGKTLMLDFEAPADDVNHLHWHSMIYHELHEMEFKVSNLTSGKVLAQRVINDEKLWGWRGDNEAGDRLRIELRWIRDTAPNFPERIVLADKKNPDKTRISVALQGWPEKWQPDEVFAVRLEAPGADFSSVDLKGITDDPKTRVRVELFNVTRNKMLKKYTITGASDESGPRTFTGGNSKGDQLELRLRWQRVPPPGLHSSGSAPRVSMSVVADGEPTDYYPLLGLEYEWPTRRLLWLWIPVLLFCGVMMVRLRRADSVAVSKTVMVVLVVVSLMAAVGSCLSWQQAVSTETSHMDPDGFGRYGSQMAEWVTTNDAGRREELRSTMDVWRYSWLPLTPLCVAVLLLCGVPFHPAFVVISAIASFATVLLFFRLLRKNIGLGVLASLAGSLLFLCHHFFLKSFAKPSTDPVGLLLVMAALCLVADRLVECNFDEVASKLKRTVGLAAVVFLLVIARPPGFLMAAFFVASALLADAWSRRKFQFGCAIPEGARLGLIPALLVGGLFVGFDWWDNFQAALHSSTSFHHVSTARRFGMMAVSMLQLLPLLWIGLRRSDWRRPEIWLLILWALFYLAMIIGVKAGFVTRMFLPMLPVPLALTATGLDRLCCRGGWRKCLAVTAAVITILVNVGVEVYHTVLPSIPPAAVAEWIYH